MIYKTTITADTISQDDVTADVTLTIKDNLIQDAVINCAEKLEQSDWEFFYFEAVNELDFYPENAKDFTS
jgi:hypothetical protein